MDPSTGRLQGDLISIGGAEELPAPSVPAFLDLSSSTTGLLVYRSGLRPGSQIVRRPRTGGSMEAIAPPDDYATPALSPDGMRLAVGRAQATNTYFIWMLDLSRRAFSRFTFGPIIDFYPVWSPDGQQILFSSGPEKDLVNLHLKAASGAGEKQRLTTSQDIQVAYSWSRGGQFWIYGQLSQRNSWDLWIQPTAPEAKPFPFLQSPATEVQGQFSPNGKWIAYTSNESGID
jgi:Tol biopolymer transport system component